MNHHRLIVLLAVCALILIFFPLRFSINALEAAGSSKAYLPVIFRNYKSPPAMTTSRYIQTTDWEINRAAGCNQARAGEDGIVILDFGYPAYDASAPIYGTVLINPPDNTFVSTNSIEVAALSFAQGYVQCNTTNKKIWLALGLNNSNKYSGLTSSHGSAWGQLVGFVEDNIRRYGFDSSIVATVAAMDIEFSWSNATVTRRWIDAYRPIRGNFLINFGSCDSCAWFKHPDWTPADYNWTYDDIWYVSWGSTYSVPLPIVYRTNKQDADQWWRRSLHSYTNHQSSMYFYGALTQWYACEDTAPSVCVTEGTNNPVGEGWVQLYHAVNADVRTAQELAWSTDIRWEMTQVR